MGGGVGIPPLYGLARRLTAEHRQVTAVLGYNRASDIFLAEELQALGVTVRLLTADGSARTCGLVTDGMEGVNYTHLYTCGPEAMLHAVWQRCRTDGQFSFEERMGCGFGACMAAPAAPSTATSASARTAPSCEGRRSYGKYRRHPLRPAAGESRHPRQRHLRLWV